MSLFRYSPHQSTIRLKGTQNTQCWYFDPSGAHTWHQGDLGICVHQLCRVKEISMIVGNTPESSKVHKLDTLLQVASALLLSHFNHTVPMIRGWRLWPSGHLLHLQSLQRTSAPTQSHTHEPATLGPAPGPSSCPLLVGRPVKAQPSDQWDPLSWQTLQGDLEGTLASKRDRDKAGIWRSWSSNHVNKQQVEQGQRRSPGVAPLTKHEGKDGWSLLLSWQDDRVSVF